MLKIKDNVDLKELEKFEFKYWEYDKTYYTSDFTIKKNRHIAVHNGGNWHRNDVLYDLIKADLVEKVEKEGK